MSHMKSCHTDHQYRKILRAMRTVYVWPMDWQSVRLRENQCDGTENSSHSTEGLSKSNRGKWFPYEEARSQDRFGETYFSGNYKKRIDA